MKPKPSHSMPPFKTLQDNLPAEQRTDLAGMSILEKMAYLRRWLLMMERQKSRYMLFLVMYDIENNKIRTHIAKYLIREGCMRIQKSVYLAKGTAAQMRRITDTLREVNEAYENHDSIFVLPVPQEKFNNMKVIGKNITFEVVTRPKRVLII